MKRTRERRLRGPASSGRKRIYLELAAAFAVLVAVACSSTLVGPSATDPDRAPPTALATVTAAPAAAPVDGGSSEPNDSSSEREAAQSSDDPAETAEDLNPDGPKDAHRRFFRQLLPRDAIRPVYDPSIATPDKVDLDYGEMVIGVSHNGEARAYPIRPLIFREMVNDVLGGTPILATW